MRILGKNRTIKRRTESVPIGKDNDDEAITLTLSAPRLNAVEELHASLPLPVEPVPPVGEAVKGPRGELIRDAQGRPVTSRNRNDPAYLKALERHEESLDKFKRARTVALLVECIGDQLGFDADLADFDGKEGSKGALIDYYDALWVEIEKAGFDAAAINRLIDAAMRLVHGGDEFKEARDDLVPTSGN